MFLNTLGLICVSLCSLLSPNNREVNEPIYNNNLNLVNRNGYELWNVGGDLINKSYLNSLLEWNAGLQGEYSFDFLTIGEMIDYYLDYGTADVMIYPTITGQPNTTGAFGYYFHWADINLNSEWLNQYNTDTNAVKSIYIKLDSLLGSSTGNYNYLLYEYQFIFRIYLLNNTTVDYPFLVNAMVTPSGSISEYEVVNSYNKLRYILVNKSITNVMGESLLLKIMNTSNTTFNSGYNSGYQVGYNEALDLNNNETAYTIFSGIMGIALVPINMFLRMFNFEVFGINLAGFVSGILTVAVIVIILRLILGGKSNDK